MRDALRWLVEAARPHRPHARMRVRARDVLETAPEQCTTTHPCTAGAGNREEVGQGSRGSRLVSLGNGRAGGGGGGHERGNRGRGRRSRLPVLRVTIDSHGGCSRGCCRPFCGEGRGCAVLLMHLEK
jgi:hypothetical protein